MPTDVLSEVWNGTLREHFLLVFNNGDENGTPGNGDNGGDETDLPDASGGWRLIDAA